MTTASRNNGLESIEEGRFNSDVVDFVESAFAVLTSADFKTLHDWFAGPVQPLAPLPTSSGSPAQNVIKSSRALQISWEVLVTSFT